MRSAVDLESYRSRQAASGEGVKWPNSRLADSGERVLASRGARIDACHPVIADLDSAHPRCGLKVQGLSGVG